MSTHASFGEKAIRRTDIAVVGLGSIGSMALWQTAAASGQSVLGIEQYGRVHAEGAYAGESRLFRVAAKEGRMYTPALLRSRELWRELGAATGRELLIEAGALSIAPQGHPSLAETLESIREFGLPHTLLDADQLRRRYPQFHIEPDDVGVLDSLGGALRPEAAILAATTRAMELGAETLYNTAVTGVSVTPDEVVVSTESGPVVARKVIVTAGPWVTDLVPEIADLVTVRNYALTWMMPQDITLFTPERLPGFMRDLDGVHAFGVPTLDGYSIKICPQLSLLDVGHVSGRPSTLTRDQVEWVGEQAQRMIPGLIPEPVRWSIHPDSQTPSTRPIIDVVGDGRVVIAAGLSGNGFKFAPVYGAAVADLARQGASPWQQDAFTLAAHRVQARIAPAPAAPLPAAQGAP